MTTTLRVRPPATNGYRYVARDADGKRRRGHIDARSDRGAKTALMEQGLVPLKTKERKGFNLELTPKRVKQTDLLHFTRQLAAFVRAGVPILEALDGLAAVSDNPTMKRTLADVSDALRAGEDLTTALAEHTRVFPAYYHTAVRASERTGNLDVTLDRLADYLERSIDSRRKVRSAVAYPAVIMVFAIVVVIVLATFVIPRFQSFFASLGVDLPLPTRMLVALMSFVVSWGWLVALLSVAFVVLLLTVGRTPRGKAIRDRVLLRIPAVGGLIRTALVERYCRALGSMAQAAVPLPEALEIAAIGTSNVVYRERLLDARVRTLQGDGVAEPLAATELFPPAAIQMIHAGEETGSLERQLENTADFYEKQLDFELHRFTAMFEPAVILVAGLIVGFVAVALVSAMYGMMPAVT